jgi:hypothetical protein
MVTEAGSTTDTTDETKPKYQYNTRVVGGQFQKGFNWSDIRAGTTALIVPEPTNLHDKNALSVHVNLNGKSIRIGYIPKELAKILAPHVNSGELNISAKLTWVSGSSNVHMHYNLLEREADPEDRYERRTFRR